MPSRLKYGDALEAFLHEKVSYEDLDVDFDDTAAGYEKLRDTAKRSVASFDEYIEFYRQFIEDVDSEVVYADLNRNATRSVKNMVLQSSRSGRRFPIRNVREIESRISTYQDLGVDQMTPRIVASTVLEHVYDNDEDMDYRLYDSLLQETPSTRSLVTELFALARFAAVAQQVDSTTDGFQAYCDNLIAALPDPFPEDDRSAEEYWTESQEKPYGDPKKREFAQVALVRDPSRDRLAEYLYLVTADFMERHRHKNREDPRRGELQLALRLSNVLENRLTEAYSKERSARVESYRKLALAQLKSGNAWNSDRDDRDLPQPDFVAATKHYYRAAETIKPVDFNRYLKYFSHAVRFQAKMVEIRGQGPANGWKVSSNLHSRFAELVTNLKDEPAEDELKTINDTVVLHRCFAHEAAAVAACYSESPPVVRERLDQAWDLLDNAPIYINTDLMQDLNHVANGLEAESHRDYQRAIAEYESVDAPRIAITPRTRLAEIKQAVDFDDHDQARELAEEAFGTHSVITAAVRILSGKTARLSSLPDEPLGIVGTDPAKEWSLLALLGVIAQSTAFPQSMQIEIEELLLSL